MIKLILGLKGSGKTKQLIDLANAAAQSDNGSVICLEKGTKLTFDINHSVRLIDTDQYYISNLNEMLAFIDGIFASNYDITTIFIDSIFKIVPNSDMNSLGEFLDKISKYEDKNFTITASSDIALATDSVKKYLWDARFVLLLKVK